MSAMETLYIIIDAGGNVRPHRRAKNGTGSVYSSKAEAVRQAKHDGDSVVPLIWDKARQPIFIRHKKLDPAKDPSETNGAG